MASLLLAFCNLRLAKLATPQSQQEFVERCLVFIYNERSTAVSCSTTQGRYHLLCLKLEAFLKSEGI